MVTVRPLSASLPELDERCWSQFDDLGLVSRAILLAYAGAIDNPLVIAASWDGPRLRGLAVGMIELHPADRRVLVVMIPGAHRPAHGTGVWITGGEDALAVTTELIGALARHAREAGLTRLTIARWPADEPIMKQAAAGLGCRPFAAPSDHQLVLPAGLTWEAHLAALGRKRAWKLRFDLRRAAAAGAEIADECPPSAAALEAAWPLLGATLGRNASRLRLRTNVLAALAPGAITLCKHGGRLIGFLFRLRSGGVTQFVHFGHSDAPPLHVASALWAHALEAEIQRGARLLLLGTASETLKRRLGATAVPQVHYFLRC